MSSPISQEITCACGAALDQRDQANTKIRARAAGLTWREVNRLRLCLPCLERRLREQGIVVELTDPHQTAGELAVELRRFSRFPF